MAHSPPLTLAPTAPDAPADSLRLLHVLCPARYGGLERVVLTLAAGQSRRGHRVTVAAVVARSADEPPVLGALRDAGVEVVPVHVPGRRYWRERARVAELCTLRRPQVVHTHGWRVDLLDAPVAQRLGLPVVSTVHGRTGDDWKVRAYEWFQYRRFRKLDAVIAVSEPLAEQLRTRWRVPARTIHAIPNAWTAESAPLPRAEARRVLGIPPRQHHVGWVGRLGREKGPDVLVDALALLDGPDVVASLLGDGVERAALQRRADGLGVAGRLRFHGVVENAARLVSAFDALVISSRTEGTPMVLLEAMAAGVPVVATRVGGIPHAVSEREALLVPPEDPAALAEAIRAVFLDPLSAAARARAARDRLAREFATDPWLDRYDAIYRAVLRTRE